MAKVDTLTLLRARVSSLPRPPWKLGLLLVADVADFAASAAFASLTPAHPALARGPYPILDVPRVVPALTMSVAFLGAMIGLMITVELVAELVMLYRRSQIAAVLARRRRR
jgi:hypothetical protein